MAVQGTEPLLMASSGRWLIAATLAGTSARLLAMFKTDRKLSSGYASKVRWARSFQIAFCALVDSKLSSTCPGFQSQSPGSGNG